MRIIGEKLRRKQGREIRAGAPHHLIAFVSIFEWKQTQSRQQQSQSCTYDLRSRSPEFNEASLMVEVISHLPYVI